MEERQRAAFIRERGDALGLTLRRLEAAEELTDTLAEFVGGGCRAMEVCGGQGGTSTGTRRHLRAGGFGLV